MACCAECAQKGIGNSGIGDIFGDIFGFIGDAGSFVVDQVGGVVNAVGGAVGLAPVAQGGTGLLDDILGVTQNVGNLLGTTNTLYTTITGKPLIGATSPQVLQTFLPTPAPTATPAATPAPQKTAAQRQREFLMWVQQNDAVGLPSEPDNAEQLQWLREYRASQAPAAGGGGWGTLLAIGLGVVALSSFGGK